MPGGWHSVGPPLTMLTPPTGTVTFLFTDIEGSTQLWQNCPASMQRALARHDELLRHVIEMNEGHVFKTVGDSFYAAFSTPVAAAGAALDAQQALAEEAWVGLAPLRVRMALHTGAPETRNGDYFGRPLNLAARLLAAGHGGQTLVSSATRELLQGALPDGMELRDLGEQRLKDLDRPEHVFQLINSLAPGVFPPLRSIDVAAAASGNLPVELTTFIGRECETAEVRRLLGTTRLLNLMGSGGTGKTRLALQAASEVLDEFPDGVWLVELAMLSDGDRVPSVVAAALGVAEEPARPLIETLVNHLRSRTLLLILDNCEQIADDAARLVQALLRSCPALRLLVTSRHVLGVPGEVTWTVPTMSVPDVWRDPLDGGDLLQKLPQYEGMRLFVERATAAKPSFAITRENAPIIAKICWSLDGIALAIELAAARVKVLSLEQIESHLADRFRLLAARSATVEPRQQTLQALIDWSYDLLCEKERVLFRSLTVSSRGRTLEAVEAVCSGDGIDREEVLDLLSQLVDKSLITLETGMDGSARYTLLESMWDYGHEKLVAAGELTMLRDRHAQFFTRLAAEAAIGLDGPQADQWLKRVGAEFSNLRRAMERSRERPDGAEAAALLESVRNRYEQLRDLPPPR